MRLFLAFAALLGFSAAAAADIPVSELPDAARPTACSIDLDIDPARARLGGTTEIMLETAAPLTEIYLHGNGLDVSRAEALTGRMAPNPIAYSGVCPTGVARLQFQRPLQPGRQPITDSAAIDPGVRTTGLRAAPRADPGFADKLFEALVAADDPLFRRQAAHALGSDGPASLLDRHANKRLHNLEVTSLIGAQFGNPGTRQAALAWLEANLDALKPRLGGLLGGFIGVTGTLCSEADAQRVERLFRPRMTELGTALSGLR